MDRKCVFDFLFVFYLLVRFVRENTIKLRKQLDLLLDYDL